MAKIRLREKGGKPLLGMNMHVLKGHERLDYVEKYVRKVSANALWHVKKALDIGCGQGAFSLYLLAKNWSVTSIDILKPPELSLHPQLNFKQLSVYDLERDFEGENDLVLMMEIIEHLEEPEYAVEIALDMVRPGGYLLITTPWVNTWDYEEDHIWRFDSTGVLSLLSRVNYINYTEVVINIDKTFVYMAVQK